MQVDFGAESEHSLHLSSHGHFEHSTHGSPAFSPFRHPALPTIDPGLEQSAANRNGHPPMSSVHHSAPPNHLLQADNASMGSGHLAHAFYGDMSRASQTPSTPSNASPRFSAISPASQSKQMTSNYVPTDRPTPSRDVSDDTLDQAYATFILYCNPNFSTATDTSELTRLFRTPPKSDGKSFSTWALFELIRKFNAGDIKTWTQLALDLGVERPDTDKGQSTQKVQQYSVRLKRWMRAMHIDAFFEYMLGKQHPYYLQIPSPHNPFPENGRDGVPLEEDLAIRALDPKFRPKRGRRKADEGEDDVDMIDHSPAPKRPQLDTSIPFGNILQPQSAYPGSAHPDHMEGFLGAHDPWTGSAITPSSALTAASAPGRMNPNKNLTPYSASPMSGQQLRWRLNTQDNPTTPHPLSAVTPHSAHPDFFDEPQSAITPSSSKRSRRRHGPAVSSAWPSNSASSTGKLRGRPPSNRSVRDGPFVTFPANPKTKEGPTIDVNRNPGNLTPIVERAHSDPPAAEHHFRFPPTPASAVSPTNMDAQIPNASQRGHRLSLQVPQSLGNPVRLATPTVLVNGQENDASTSTTSQRAGPLYDQPTEQAQHQHHPTSSPASQFQNASPQQAQTQASIQTKAPSPLPSIPPDALKRALAASLIRAPLTGRRKRLSGTEAKALASAILSPLAPPTNPPSAPAAKTLSEPALAISIASCLGLTSAVGLGAGGPTGGVKRVECVRFRVGGDGYESPVSSDFSSPEGEAGPETGTVRESFDVFFGVSFGPGLVGEWVVKGVGAAGEEKSEAEGLGQGQTTTAAGWKGRFEAVQRKLEEREEEARVLRERVLEAVL
ncbi:hypothetical protein DPSP01_003962 [Paraphaeosphaeria sporulosa]|uniref:ARS binding protein Abp2 n=1 Tax=Paraphaeosphaeria sporulosa TaxID=1460663 RepID=A0A177CVD4_9PLEO|nr:uncharacterized protein CC84DRAFT_1161779 [Paraphaeosphaeria sporulosa]OAG10978.1 hypothetical protein CC84DRAFT_1161779 [Paraphaeosphaeria sporulosa]